VFAKILLPVFLISVALAPFNISLAEEMATDCRLRGGTVVRLTAEVCGMEGGEQASETVSPEQEGVIDSVERDTSGIQTSGNSKLDEIRRLIIDLLVKPVGTNTPGSRNPEGIERTAKFDGCRLIVDEDLHIQYGNAFSVWKDFKINSVIDLQNIDQDKIGIMAKISSKGGDLRAAAIFLEERKNKDGNNISISVLNLREGDYTKYTSHGLSAYWDTPQDDLWIADEYGYPKDTGWSTVATDRIRLLLIVNSSSEAAKLKNAFEEVNAMCKLQPVKAN